MKGLMMSKYFYLVVSVFLLSCNFAYALYEVDQVSHFVNPTNAYICAISDNGEVAAVGSEGNEAVTFYDAQSGLPKSIYTMPVGSETESLSLSATGKYLYVGTQGNGVKCVRNDGFLAWSYSNVTFPGEVQVVRPRDDTVLYVAASSYFKAIDLATPSIITNVTINTRSWAIWGIDSSLDGSVVLLKTNSDIIIVNSAGTEIAFHDVYAGNSLSFADISPDGSRFAVSYVDASSVRHISVYETFGGLLWSKTTAGRACPVIDENYNVYCAIDGSDNILYGPDGGVILTWPGGKNNMAASSDGQFAIANVGTSKFEVSKFTDVYDCYSDLKVKAALTGVQPLGGGVDRYIITILNWYDLPEDMFVESPELPVCGINDRASRTYERIFGDDTGFYFSGCGAKGPGAFPSEFSFGFNTSGTMDDYIYIEFYDRKCDEYFRTNFMDTSSICPAGDINGDCTVDLKDFAILAVNWLESGN